MKGTSITFDDTLYGVTRAEGLGVPDLDKQEQKAPFQDGSSLIDQLFHPRSIEIEGVICVGNNNAQRYLRRRDMTEILCPKDGAGLLTYTNDYGTWNIVALPEGPVFANKNANEGNQAFLINFYCPDPAWEEIAIHTETIEGKTVSKTIVIDGDVSVPFTASLRKSCQNIAIKNVTTNKTLKLSGSKFGDETITIDTAFGKKSVKSISHGLKSSTGAVLTDVAYSPTLGILVAVGQDQILFTSPDGEQWTPRFANTSLTNYTRIRWIDGYFVGTTENGRIFYSANGIDWTGKTIVAGTALYDVVYYASGAAYKWITVGASGVMYHCATIDGTWTSVSSGISSAITGIDVNGATLVCVTSPVGVYSSIDGLSWTSRTSGTANALNSIAYASTLSLWIAVGNVGTIITSPDGTTWTTRTSGTTNSLYRATYGFATLSLVVSGASGVVLISSNGTAWSAATGTGSSDARGAAYATVVNKWIAVGSSGMIEYSTSSAASAWTVLLLGKDAAIYSCAHSASLGRWCIGGSGYTAISSDGAIWTYTAQAGKLFSSMVYVDDLALFLASDSANGRVMRSSDGVTWSNSTTTLTGVKALVYANATGTLCAVGSSGMTWTSVDGDTWYGHLVDATKTFNSVAYSETTSLYVAVGLAGAVYTSVDALYWTAQSVGSSDYSCVAYSEELAQWIITASGATKISSDAEIWTSVTTYASKYAVYSAYYHAWAGCGASGELTYSYDGITWSQYVYTAGIETSRSIGVSSDGTQFLMVGDRGTLSAGNVVDVPIDAIELITFDSEFWNLEPGTNVVQITCDIGTVSGTLSYKNRYVGV